MTLGIARKSAGAQSSSSKNKEALPAALKQKILERDDYTCRYCGFRAEKYQEINFRNGDSTQHHPKNMVTSCIYCHQCMNMDKVSDFRSGVLIWLPEIEQAALHHIARSIYVARISQGPMAEAARKALEILMARRNEARARLGTDNPSILATILRDYIPASAYNARSDKLDGIRLFPLDRRIIKEADLEFNQFPQILAYWRSKAGPFEGKAPNTWLDLYREVILPQQAA